MTEVAYFFNEKTQKKYKILDLDKETEIIRLQGPNRAFNEPYDKLRFQQLGYKLVMIEEEESEDVE